MNTDSIFFLGAFLPVALLLYYLLPGQRLKNALLLLLSLIFYAFGSLQGLIVLLISAGVNFLLSRYARRKWVLILGIVWNLLLLGGYKYWSVLLPGSITQNSFFAGLLPPLGISFFTFKAISYLIDIYRKQPEKNSTFFAFLLYLSFFPQATAGPITRFSDFQPQLTDRSHAWENTAKGIRRFVVGLGKKLLLAGTLATLVDGVFALAPGDVDARLAWLAALGYMLQIYFDFSGYSDMAIGLAQMFGFTTQENFCYPYIANTIGDFWRRWHISLSSWFKDYLYIPLGGNRKGKVRAGINKLIVFVLCGIWHGSAVTFLLWGLWHGVLSALESWNVIPAKKLQKLPVIGHLYTLLAVCLGFVIFRAGSVEQGFQMLGAMFGDFSVTAAGSVAFYRLFNLQALAVLLLGVLFCLPWNIWLRKNQTLARISDILSYPAVIVLFAVCLLQLASGSFAPFIYAQF